MIKQTCFLVSVIIFLSSFLISCASTTNTYDRIDSIVYTSDYNNAYLVLEEEKNSLYKDTDNVLYTLNAGALLHYAKEYERSNALLSQAEKDIYKNFTKSISQSIGSYLVNDSVMDYAGEEYEDIYTNIFMALNYFHLGKLESAFVEIRRFDNKLKALSTKYAEALSTVREEARYKGNTTEYSDSNVQFNNSALARYISMIFYRGIGKLDSADVDRRYILDAFKTQAQLYPFPLPSSIQEELSIPSNKARLNVLAFSGLAPKKEEEVLRIPLLTGNYYKLALPIMVNRYSEINKIRIYTDTGESFSLELLEDISAIAKDTFKQKQSLIYFRSVIRSLTKMSSSVAMNVMADKVEDSGTSLLLNVLSLSSQIYTEVSEVADLRVSRYFPGSAWVGGITLNPGVYNFSVEFLSKNNHILETQRFENVTVLSNSVNLVEAICLR